ncbi:hypothetical protein [Streptomyces sp. DH37]|uniref:hypothetical protein n=1 Tax=Streptomyces sp. DH37 TaxID=3040122 RepID=UPI00244324AC|nr:hypothetical protein [Streptomyces sp. DH37]MDG9701174.1 hypothetical protein [Streptomyces sp. DH37]
MTGETTDTYFAVLADRLRARGVAEERVTATLTDLYEYLLDADTDPEAEFGPVEEFAGRLTRGTGGAPAGEDGAEPDAHAEEWRWSCDVYTDRELLNRYGDQGWEVERVDRIGRFVCRRDPDRAMRWEYRREIVGRGDRDEVSARLAPDGWEPCGRWLYIAYFKRPRAALAGPAAELPDVPGVPERRLFLSRKYRRLLAAVLVLWTVAGTGGLLTGVSPFEPGTLAGMLVGGLAGGAAGAYGLRRQLARDSGDQGNPGDPAKAAGGAAG